MMCFLSGTYALYAALDSKTNFVCLEFAASQNPSYGIPEPVICDIAKENSELEQMRQAFVLLNCFLTFISVSIMN